MKTIRGKILSSIVIITTVALLITGVTASMMNYKSTMEALQLPLQEAAKLAAHRISAELRAQTNLMKEFAYNSVLWGDIPRDEKISQLHSLKDNSGFDLMMMTDAQGISLETGDSIASLEAFRQVKSTGRTYVSEPVMVDGLGDMVFFFAAPVMRSNTFQGAVIGGKRASFLSDIIAGIKVGSGDAAIINKAGDMIAGLDYHMVLNRNNVQKKAAAAPGLKRLAAVEHNMTQGKTGFEACTINGVEQLVAYTPIPDTNGWSIDIAAVKSDFTGGTRQAIGVTLVIMVFTLIAAVLLAVRLSNSIANPIKATAQRLRLLARGDLNSAVNVVRSRDETGLLSDSLNQTIMDMREIINDIRVQLGELSEGNFCIKFTRTYKGDFQPIQDSISNITQSLNQTLAQISHVADRVSGEADQVSGGAQALSRGAAQQAASIEELASTINDISLNISSTAQKAAGASEKSEKAGIDLDKSKAEMEQMIRAMESINESSGEIGRIIKTIEDIAFQTNILALNAAVEAARAGEAGKGFAVVADEVRSLASKSAEAARDTSERIEESIAAVKNGAMIADGTARSLMLVVSAAGMVADHVYEIRSAAAEQAENVAQVTLGIDQISSVVQTNSATAEESAAASSQLSTQARLLKELVGHFKLAGDIPE